MVKSGTIKREKWGNKFVVVARLGDGRIASWTKWNNKNNTVDKLSKRFSENQSLVKGIKKDKLTNVIEIQDTRPKPRPSKRIGKFQYLVEGILKDKTKITARSRQFSQNKDDKMFSSVKNAREEAFENFWGRVHQHFQGGGSGDAEKGEEIFGKEVKNIKEGVVQYASIS